VLLAQTNGSRYVGTSVRVGLQFGGLLSGLNEQGGNPADRTGAIAGACVIFGFAPYLGNQFEVSLVSKGASDVSITTYPGPTYYHADELELRYLQFAFLGRLGGITMSPDKRSSVVPRVYAGPAAAFLLSEKWYGMDGPLDLDLEATDISLIIGAGADIRLGDRLQLTVDSRFDYGLREVAGSVKNRSSIFMVGLTY
jgi:hypothetical protein